MSRTPIPLAADVEAGLRRLRLAAIRRQAPEVLATAKAQRWTPEEVLRVLVEADLEVDGLDASFHAVFIRAPVVERVGPDVEILARHDGVPVLVRQQSCTVTSFHPELTPDGRLHAMFVESI